MQQKNFFASDNCSTVHPRVMEALQEANSTGHVISYGDDEHTEVARALLQRIFGVRSSIFFVYNGTAANVLAIRSLLKGYESVLTPVIAHLCEDECGGLEAIAGLKIETIPHERGKIRVEDIPACLGRRGFVHSVQPRLLSITQSNELGLVYSIEEMQAIGRACREHELLFHVDGARISNAVASVLMSDEPNWAERSSEALMRRARDILAAMTVDAGVHALSLGGTKNGLMFGEAVVFMNAAGHNDDTAFYQKQIAQLTSKMRYISVQFEAIYGSDLWIRNALHANAMAQQLAEGIGRLAERGLHARETPTLRVVHPVQANALFVKLPRNWAERLQPRYRFYAWGEDSYRFMCSWDSTAEDIAGFMEDLGELTG